MLIQVILIIGRRKHFGFIDIVDAERLELTRFAHVSDSDFGHDGDRDGFHDALDQRRMAHARDATIPADIRGNLFKRHDGDGTGFLSDRGLLRGHDVHDDAPLEHLRKTALDGYRSELLLQRSLLCIPIVPDRAAAREVTEVAAASGWPGAARSRFHPADATQSGAAAAARYTPGPPAAASGFAWASG